MATLQDLLSQKAALDRQIEDAKRTQQVAAIAQIRQLMADNALTVVDISAALPGSRKAGKSGPSPRSVKKVAVKYRHPTTGESWTGRGLKPKWLRAELDNGKSISDFSI